MGEHHLCRTLCTQSFSLLKWSHPFSWTSFYKRFSRITTQSGLFTKWDLQPVLKMATLLCLHGQSNDLWSIFLYELKIQKCTALLCNLWPLALKVFSMYFGKTRSTSSLLSYEFSSAVLRILFSLCNSIFCL